jgi:hypothetical protein
MNLEDQANAVAGLQRQRTNQLLENAVISEKRQSEAARIIANLEKMYQTLQDAQENYPYYATLGTIALNTYAMETLGDKVLPLYDFNVYYDILDTKWQKSIEDLCGSSIDLRRALNNVCRLMWKFHTSAPSDLIKTYLECLQLIRRQVQNEGWATKLASITKNPSEQPNFPASAEWRSLMHLIAEKFQVHGCSFEKLFDKKGFFGIDDSVLLLFTGVNGFPIDYLPDNNEFAVDIENLNSMSRPIFEIDGKLLQVESIVDISNVRRCFLRDTEGNELVLKNFLLGWDLGQTSASFLK